MPSDRSLYRKIQVVLEVARATKASSLNDLRKEVVSRRPPSFLTPQYNAKRDLVVDDISEKSIRKAVSACTFLGLLDAEGRLTEQGREASYRGKFEATIVKQVNGVFEANQIDLSVLNSVIAKSLRSFPPVLPTARLIWDEVHPPLRFGVFSRLLTLFGQCGGASTSQCKVYLAFSKKPA